MIFGWAIPGLFGAKDMSGYWSAGRGAICCGILSDWLPHWLSHWLPERIYVPPIPVSKSIILSIYLPEWVVHKFVRTGSDFIYTKNSGRPGSGFYLHKEFGGSGSDLSTQRKISALRAPWVSKEKSWQINDIFKNFPALRAPIC